VQLSGFTSSAPRLAVVGLAKNTGKTQTLLRILGEAPKGSPGVGVTSIGRDGEQHDVVDDAIAKPAIPLAAGDLVATTDRLLDHGAGPADVLWRTEYRTPLGRVVIARLAESGPVEIAGPSTAAGIRAVSDAMLRAGARQVLIDGAIDRRASASPAVADGVVMATGAVLGRELADVVSRTRHATELLRLPAVSDPAARRAAERAPGNLLLTADGRALPLGRGLGLGGAGEPARTLRRHFGEATHLVLSGGLAEPLLAQLLAAAARAPLTLVVRDATRVFLRRRGALWYRDRGLRIEVLQPARLLAITVNPVAPRSHRFDSGELRARVAEIVPGLPVCDVLDLPIENEKNSEV
jgi:hypothetical protein